jgi:hypothetical protein
MGKWTVQELIDAGMTIHAWCHNPHCHHNARLDLVKLREKLGPDARAMTDDLTPKLKCARCGGKRLGLTYSPDATPRSPNPYLRAKGG